MFLDSHSLACHFKICRFQTQDQAVIQNVAVSTEQSLGVFQRDVNESQHLQGWRRGAQRGELSVEGLLPPIRVVKDESEGE